MVYPDKDQKDPNFAANFGANPTNQWYWILSLWSAGAPDALNVYFDVKITYYCKLSTRKSAEEDAI